jgi:hypothetical protein
MAYKITTIPILANTTIGSGSAGGTSLSDPIDLRNVNRQGSFSIIYDIGASGAAATAATCGVTYLCAQRFEGPYILAGTACTVGTGGGLAGSQGVIAFSPITAPFMKLRLIAGTSGTAKVTNLALCVR